MSCAFRPDGQQIAVSTVDAQILFFHPETGQQMASIEGKHDLGYARRETDKVTGKKLNANRSILRLYVSNGTRSVCDNIEALILTQLRESV